VGPTPETIVCGLSDLLRSNKCSRYKPDLILDVSVFALLVGLVLAYSSYRFYRTHDLSENGRNKVEIILLVSVALIMIIGGIIPKPVTVLSGGIQPTDIQLSPVYEKNDEMIIQVTNKGSRAINLTAYTIYYGPPNFDPVTYSGIESQASQWSVRGDGNQCFTSNMSEGTDIENDILRRGESTTCSTGIKFPGKYEKVEIRLEAKNFDYSTTYTCYVQTSNARTC
jgi:heme/copper-type cytochrome/quinol oxidase subunit 2